MLLKIYSIGVIKA